MKIEQQHGWTCTESGFDTADQVRLFYRSWQPIVASQRERQRVLVFLHRGHEHSGRIPALLEQFAGQYDRAFAWDARGHGHSPGERGDAPGFGALVQDFDTFIAHLCRQHGVALDQIVVVANSVGAVIAATWVHDYAPPIRGLIMAAAAFSIKLYVPLAKPALRLALKFKPDLFITSYIRSSMLTHCPQQAAGYDNDPLITKNIAARVLLDLADTAQRIVLDAAAIDVPVLMLVAGKDFVVKEAPQRQFFDALSSSHKRYVRLDDSYHALFYERDTRQAFDASRQFIDECFDLPPRPANHYDKADRNSASQRAFDALKQGSSVGPLARLFFGIQRATMGTLGWLSDGIRLGHEQGFDSGASLDYVYRNVAGGGWLIGKTIDRGYLDAVGWRGIRLRKLQLQRAIGECIAALPAGRPIRILDVAAGEGRYVLETVKRFQDRQFDITLRDFDGANLERAAQLAERLQLQAALTIEQRDAFDPASYRSTEAPYDIVIVSGLYELFTDNAGVQQSLQGIASQLRDGGHLIYTGQPWHPQLAMIALTLTSHRGAPWVMRPRPQAEMDGLVRSAGLHKVASQIGLEGIFTVSVARKGPAPGAAG